MPDASLPGYPTPSGVRYMLIATHQGPANYQAGGETVTASTFGWGSFDGADAVSSSWNANNSGNFIVQCLTPVAQAPAVANNNWTAFPNMPTGANNLKIKWTQANGNEVANNTNLSSEFVRIQYFGG